MIKIKSFLMPERKKGIVLALPIVWVRDLNLKPGDAIDVYRDKHDQLIIVPLSRAPKPVQRRAS